mmetsp:Transcript_27723/g.62737  ORF Transcript_27723/g.62737 Transcript_27723/m.62737 type:complete len:385 (+) Transcript_27723:542-1696(+)
MQQFDFVSRLRLDMSWEHLLPVPSNLLSLLTRDYTIWVPQMNRNSGVNDKFAVGTRKAMGIYLNRVHLIDKLRMKELPRRSAVDMRKTPAKWICGANPERNCSKSEPCCWASPLSPQKQYLPNCTGKVRSTCGQLSLNSERFLELALWLAGNITVVHRQDWLFCKYGETGHSWTTCTKRMRAQQPCQSMVCVAWSAGGCSCQNKTCAKGYNPYCTPVTHTQLRLDGTLISNGPLHGNSSLVGPQFGHLRTLAHRAVVRTFGRAGNRASGRSGGGRTGSKIQLVGSTPRLPETAGERHYMATHINRREGHRWIGTNVSYAAQLDAHSHRRTRGSNESSRPLKPMTGGRSKRGARPVASLREEREGPPRARTLVPGMTGARQLDGS